MSINPYSFSHLFLILRKSSPDTYRQKFAFDASFFLSPFFLKKGNVFLQFLLFFKTLYVVLYVLHLDLINLYENGILKTKIKQ